MSLTDDWKDGAIATGTWCWVRVDGKQPEPMVVDCDGWLSSLDDSYKPDSVFLDLEILAICDYDHFVELTEKVEKLEKAFIKALQNNDELSAVITGNELEIDHLRQLLKECQTFFEEENPKDFTVLSERMEDLLTKIKEVLK